MHLKILSLMLWAGLFSGCIIVAGPDRSGEVTFNWTLDGRTCREETGAPTIRIDIPGVVLPNNGTYPCQNNGVMGVNLGSFFGGRYTYTIEALDFDNQVLFSDSGEFVVDLDVVVNVSIDRVANAGGYAWLSWNFPPLATASVPTCEQAGVSFVDVSFDGTVPVRYPCADGMSSSGAVTPILAVGQHTFEAVAVTNADYPLYRSSSTFVISATTPVAVDIPLSWSVGGAALRWEFIEGGSVRSCAQAGVTQVQVNFYDATGQWVYGDTGDIQACNAAPILYNALQAGSYQVLIRGLDTSGNIRFENAWTTDAPVTVTNGQFPTVSQARTFSLNRK